MKAEPTRGAREVFVLLNKKFRISRNIRLTWYLSHLNSPLLPSSASGDCDREESEKTGLEVLSVIGRDGEKAPSDQGYLLTPRTAMSFLSSGYRFVFALDLSASVLRVDTYQECVMLEAILVNLEECLISLLHTLKVPGSERDIAPNIYLTVFAQWKHAGRADTQHLEQGFYQKVIVQGCRLNKAALPCVLQAVKGELYSTKYMGAGNQQASPGNLQRHDDLLTAIVKTSLLALKLLPPNTSSGIVIFTDGVIGEPEPTGLDKILSLCQNATASCSFVHVNPSDFPLCNFGCISHTELMRFVALSTKGSYIDTFRIPAGLPPHMNYYHRALLFWSFQVSNGVGREQLEPSAATSFSRPGGGSDFELRNLTGTAAQSPALITRKQGEKNLRVSLATVVSSRLREGYEIVSVSFPKSLIQVVLVLRWWKNHTSVQYTVASGWPLVKNLCKVEVHVIGTYEFLRDISRGKPLERWTRSRKLVVHRFLLFLQDLQHSDHMLQYLSSFSSDPDRYAVSEMLVQTQSVFYHSQGSAQFALTAPADFLPPTFSSYWKPVLSLDISIWQRWLHIHHVQVILKHDTPLPKDLYSHSSSDGVVHCKFVFAQLLTMLRKWCKFVLLEGHTYVQFVYDDGSHVPSYFFLVRLINKSPLIVLKLAFLIGVPGSTRKQHIDELKNKVASLGTGATPTSIKRVRHSSSRASPVVRPHQLSDKHPNVVLLTKPLDRILVRHGQIPRDYLLRSQHTEPRAYFHRGPNTTQHNSPSRELRWYLKHRRYVWSLSNVSGATPQLSLDTTYSLPSLLMKLRMAEGYHVAHSAQGIVNLAREFPMESNFDEDACGGETPSCLVQCVLFPPKIKTSDASQSANESEEEDEDSVDTTAAAAASTAPDNSKENLLAMEIWCEPQDGLISQSRFSPHASTGSSSSGFRQLMGEPLAVPYYDGLSCDQLAASIAAYDTNCISNVITLEHLQLMCQSPSGINTLPQEIDCYPASSAQDISMSNDTLVSDDVGSEKGSFERLQSCQQHGSLKSFAVNEDTTFFPCMFNLVDLLEQSQRVTLQFNTLLQDPAETNGPNKWLFSNFHLSMERVCNSEVCLSEADQSSLNAHFSKAGILPKPSESDGADEAPEPGKWSCFLKQGDNGQVFVVLFPSTYDDLLLCFDPKGKAGVAGDEMSTDVGESTPDPVLPPTAFSSLLRDTNENQHKYRIARRISIKRMTSSGEGSPRLPGSAGSARTLPVYVYNCSMQMLVSSALQSVRSNGRLKWPDSVQDHRFAPSESVGDLKHHNHHHFFRSTPSRESSEGFKPHSPVNVECADDVFPLVSQENFRLSGFCSLIVDAFKRSFVAGVFAALQKKEQAVSGDDLQIATDVICHEFIEEIDITNFMLLNSPQVVEFKARHLAPSSLSVLPHAADSEAEVDIEDMCKEMKSDLAAPKPSATSAPLPLPIGSLTSEKTPTSTSPEKSSAFMGTNQAVFTEERRQAEDVSLAGVSLNPTGRRSAFTTVRQRASECERDSSSSEDEQFDSRKRKAQGRQRERTLTQTLPVKQVVEFNKINAGAQSGWHNLPGFPLSTLSTFHARHLSGSNEQLEKFFHSVLRKHCCAIPDAQDLYYCVDAPSKVSKRSRRTFSGQADSDNDEVQFASKPVSAADLGGKPIFTFEKDTPTREDDTPSVSSDFGAEEPPLFLCMTCTVRDKSTGNHGTVSVRSLPTNLAAVLDSFEKPCDEVDLSQIKITLDLIWLYLPVVQTETDCPSCTDPEQEVDSSDLPMECLPCVEGVKASILWLLQDEIVSSLRSCEAITTSALDQVADHIVAKRSSNCLMQAVSLQFIFGAESSRDLFANEFESIRFKKYKLKKEEGYYYLSLERDSTGFLPITFGNIDEPDSLVYDPSFTCIITKNGTLKMADEKQTSTPLPDDDKRADRSSSRGKQGLKYSRRSCVSLYQREHDNPCERSLYKASSSVELSSAGHNAKRSSSVSNIHLDTACSKLYKPTASSKSTPLQPLRHIPSPAPFTHQPLHASLSCGKDSYAQLNLLKDSSMSMPVTPVNYSHADIHFSFPAAATAADHSKLSAEHSFGSRQPFGRDLALSPMSDNSPRHFSQSSLIASGYEGEMSDTEDDDYYLQSLQEANSQMPNFWLIVKLENDCAKIFFHRRGSGRVIKSFQVEQTHIFHAIVENVHCACRAVNQTLLLRKLHESHLCHTLLVEEEVEDVWGRNDDYSSSVYRTTGVHDDMGSGEDMLHQQVDYLAAAMNLPPGHFECDQVREDTIVLHPRISGNQSGSGVTSTTPSAMSTVRSFLKNFAVINQKNMFVFRMEDCSIYYCRMRLEVHSRSETSSRRSSVMSSSANLELVPSHVRESRESLYSVNNDNDPRLVIAWYGVHSCARHEDELLKVRESVERKLNDAVLECITVMLSRNQMFKLTPADVALIQPRTLSASFPVPRERDDVVSFRVSSALLNKSSLPAFLFYLHQNIQQFVIVPRYTEPNNPNGFFLSSTAAKGNCDAVSPGRKVSAVGGAPSCIYLHSSAFEKGRQGHGIACIHLDAVCQEGAAPCDFERLTFEDAAALTEVVFCETDSETPDHTAEAACSKVCFRIWKRGSLQLEGLNPRFQSAIRHTLCDMLVEQAVKCSLFENTAVSPVKTETMRKLFDVPQSDNAPSQQPTLLSTIQSKLSGVAIRTSASPTTPIPSTPQSAGKTQHNATEMLSETYSHFLPKWLAHMAELKCPSITSSTFHMKSESSLRLCTENLVRLLPSHLADSKVFLFARPEPSGSWKLHTAQCRKQTGVPMPTLAVSKNFYLWKRSIGRSTDLQRPNVAINKFQPHDVANKPEVSPCPQHALISSTSYISRQHFALAASGENGELSVFMYNVSSDRASAVQRQLSQCAAFHNARHNMLQGVTFQKLGLFQHFTTQQRKSERNNDTGAFKVETLAKNASFPPERQKSVSPFVDKYFDDMYCDAKAVQLIDRGKAPGRDPAYLYGQQLLGIAKIKYRRMEELMHLSNLYEKYRDSPSNVCVVSSTTLAVLLSHARHFHTQIAPVLFSRAARRRFANVYAPEKVKVRADSGPPKQHEKLARRSSFLESYRRKSGDSIGKLATLDQSEDDKTKEQPEFDQEQLSDRYFEIYAQHWKGFSTLQVDSLKSGSGKDPAAPRYLFRVMPGGVILISVTFRSNEVVVKMYVTNSLSVSQEPLGWIRPKSAINFLNACDKYKSAMEVIGFTLNLQLRELQSCIAGKTATVGADCPLVDILRSLADCYQPLLSDLAHHLLRGSVAVPCMDVTSQQLYAHIVEYAQNFGLRRFGPVNQQPVLLCAANPLNERHADDCRADTHSNRNICVAVTSGAGGGAGVLMLDYFVLVTIRPAMQNVVEPKRSPADKWSSKLARRYSAVAHSSIAKTVAELHGALELGTGAFGGGPEHVHDTSCFVFCEGKRTEDFLREAGARAETECHRRQLWRRLVLCCNGEKTSSGNAGSLSMDEFARLRKLMCAERADEADPRLFKLLRRGNAARRVRDLQRRLLKRFPKTSAAFASPDGSAHVVCVIGRTAECLVSVSADCASNAVSVESAAQGPCPLPPDVAAELERLLRLVLNELCLDLWSHWW